MTTIMRFLPQLDRAVKLAGTHDLADVLEAVRDDKARIFANETGMIVAEIESYPKGRVLNYWIAAGDMDGVLALVPDVEAWGQAEGCVSQRFTGRRGWGRILVQQGWAESPLRRYEKGLSIE